MTDIKPKIFREKSLSEPCIGALDKLDADKTNSDSVIPSHLKFNPTDNETGWDRIKAMYRKDEFGHRSGEMFYVAQGAAFAGITGVILGGYLGGKQARDDFVRKNEITLFHGQLDGRRRLNDYIMLNTFRRAFYYGWRLAFFTSSYLLTVMTISTYRNKSSVLEYMTAGGVSGSLFKFNLGLKGMISGGVVGATLGTVVGSIATVAMWLTGTTTEELRYWRNQRKAKYQSELQEHYKRIREKSGSGAGELEYDALALAHDKRLEEKP